MFDLVVHRWLRLPYTLHVRVNQRARRPKATIVFLHGLGQSAAIWDRIASELPKDVRIITLDLLGFGKSPRPKWATYDAERQAQSVLATLLKLRVSQPVILVGHSMGTLVSIEVARRHPRIVKSLLLCSPPLYKAEDHEEYQASFDRRLKDFYRLLNKRPDRIVQISKMAVRLGLATKALEVSKDNVHAYISALEAAIINQDSMAHALAIKNPIRILYGKLDPVLVPKNLDYLAKHNPNVELKSFVDSHEIRQKYRKKVVAELKRLLEV